MPWWTVDYSNSYSSWHGRYFCDCTLIFFVIYGSRTKCFKVVLMMIAEPA